MSSQDERHMLSQPNDAFDSKDMSYVTVREWSWDQYKKLRPGT